jgi:signal transduction histidine kinase
MKSLYLKILLGCLVTLLVSFGAFFVISTFVARHAAGPRGFIAGIHRWQTAEAVEVYESRGVDGLRAYFAKLHRFIGEQDYLTDSQGRDVISGDNRSSLLKLSHADFGPPPEFDGHIVIVNSSEDGRYRFITLAEPPIHLLNLSPFYFLILVAVAVVCWLMALNIATPLRDLSRAVDRFGRGELDIRLQSRRRDEIGDLSRSFDHMADRIGTLLTAERRLLQDVSHELRSPLARLSFAAELTRTAENRDQAAAKLKKEIARLTELVGALVEVTRAEGDPAAAPFEAVRLDDLLFDVVEDCRVEADARGCDIALNVDHHLTLSGDRELLRRALENVVRNALRYTPPDSEVEVEMNTTPETINICVRDCGPGVPDELLPRIFEPFFRVDDSRDSATGGVGLGLAIAKRAVAVHHGRVWAQNGNPGLWVSIELPR